MGWDVLWETWFFAQGLYSRQIMFTKIFSLPKQHINSFCTVATQLLLFQPLAGHSRCFFLDLQKNPRPVKPFFHRLVKMSAPSLIFFHVIGICSLIYSPHVLTPYVPDKTHFVGFWILVWTLSNFKYLKVHVAKAPHPLWTWKIKSVCCKTFPIPAFLSFYISMFVLNLEKPVLNLILQHPLFK